MSKHVIDIDDDSDSGSSNGGSGAPDKKPFVMRGHLLKEEIDIDDDSGSSSGGSGAPDKKPFVMRGHLLQEELAKGEKRFGEIDWSVRITEPPPKETQSASYSEEEGLAAANSSVVEQHEWLTCQQFDGRDPVRDQRIPSVADILAYAENHPQAQLTLDPTLKLALENAKRNQATATPTLKPAGM